jgi:dipeptidyl aminopeptidase/acylaminoacyl peptidase
VPVENSLLLYQAARGAGVGAELHLYERGPHGFGTRTDVGPASGWVDRLFDWLRTRDFLPSATGITPCPHAACGGR